MAVHGEMLIGGTFVGGPCDQSVSKAVIRSPWDGHLVGTAAEGGPKDLETAIAIAQEAFQEWRRTPRHVRQGILRASAAEARRRRQELAELMADEIGKPVTLGLAEIDRFCLTFEIAADALSSWGAVVRPADVDHRGGSSQIIEHRFPRGVVLAFTPYNWPFNLVAHKAAAALAAGCTIVIKPSPKSLLSSYEVGRILHKAGVPPGVVQMLDSPNEAAAKAAANPQVSVLSFTGSGHVGWMLKRSAHDQAHVCLELGGDASAVVCDDADWRKAVPQIAAGAFGYAGQVCIKVQHLLVQSGIYEEVKEAMVEATRRCPTGDPRDAATVCGPVIDDASASRVMEWIEEAKSAGAKVLAGGTAAGRLVSPTLLENVPDGVRLAEDEDFGPVLTIEKFGTVDEAIQRVNRSPFGLQAGVFTESRRTARKFYQELQVGGVVIGGVPTLRFDIAAYGGEKGSGFGREGVFASLDELTYPKTLLDRID